ncbi:serine protease [Tychonema sp. LEGE 07199]|uniref:serine protease n=1 Tax=unclassified Tychonema TaxID=2642144 RepID=UPI001882349D|nr:MULTISPECIES: serine protease [unclassified Tychonema]MBE9124331.1 serine protease [Tychonema sp. LEGE 07199]MBE9131941.1 serine protease [Tychonema sp. LEGE 07196]
MNKGLIRLTLVVGLAAALGACGGESTTTPTPSGTDTTTTPPPVTSPVPKESPKATPGAGATVAPKKAP